MSWAPTCCFAANVVSSLSVHVRINDACEPVYGAAGLQHQGLVVVHFFDRQTLWFPGSSHLKGH